MKKLAILLIAFLGTLLICNLASAGEPRVLKAGMYVPATKVDDLFNKDLIDYSKVSKPLQVKMEYYRDLFLKNDYNNGVGIKVKRMAVSPGATVTSFKLHMQINNRYNQCNVVIMDVKKSGNYDYWAGPC